MLRVHGLILLLSMGVLGCTKPTGAGNGETRKSQPALPTTASSEAKRPSIESVPIPADIKPTLTDADRPDSVSAFVAKFHELHQKDVFAPFVELSWWGEMDGETRNEYLKAVRQTFWSAWLGKLMVIRSTKKIKVSSIDLSGPEKPDGYMAAFPLCLYGEDMCENLVPKPTHDLEVQAHIDDSTSMFFHFLIGEHEGKFYFCTVK